MTLAITIMLTCGIAVLGFILASLYTLWPDYRSRGGPSGYLVWLVGLGKPGPRAHSVSDSHGGDAVLLAAQREVDAIAPNETIGPTELRIPGQRADEQMWRYPSDPASGAFVVRYVSKGVWSEIQLGDHLLQQATDVWPFALISLRQTADRYRAREPRA